jgi:hypothetical protein
LNQDLFAATAVWDATLPHEATDWFGSLSVPWWIAGGWAIDLFLKRQTRPHADLDIGVLRRNVGEVLRSIPGLEAFEARDGVLTRLSEPMPRPEVNSLWCRASGARQWKFELLLDESEGETWIYRRDLTVRKDLRSLVRHNCTGTPYLSPEVQLLYKAKGARPRDEQDFDAVLPLLSQEARDWLRQSLLRTLPSHSWIRTIERRAAL